MCEGDDDDDDDDEGDDDDDNDDDAVADVGGDDDGDDDDDDDGDYDDAGTTSNQEPLVCTICRLPVTGLSIVCPVCGHGGHLQHVQDWFADHHRCPAAKCSCLCKKYL